MTGQCNKKSNSVESNEMQLFTVKLLYSHQVCGNVHLLSERQIVTAICNQRGYRLGGRLLSGCQHDGRRASALRPIKSTSVPL